MHLCVPGKQTRHRTRENVWRQFCACGKYRDVQGDKAGPWHKPDMSPNMWHARARRILETLEWSGKNGRYSCCPVCRSLGPHREGCDLDLLLHGDRVQFRHDNP